MGKKKKRIIFAAIIVLIGVISVSRFLLQRGNRKQKDSSMDASSGVISFTRIGYNYSDKGVVTVGEDELMHFTDAVTKETTVVCDRANCQHEPYDENTNPDPICNGYTMGRSASGTVGTILMAEENIYFWGAHENDQGELQDVEIYRADLNGENKKKVATVPDSTLYHFMNAASDGRYLVISYMVSHERDESGALMEPDRPEGGIIILDLRDYSVVDDRTENMRVPTNISFTDQRIYVSGLCMTSDYSNSAMASLSEEELTQYLEENEYTGMYIYNLERHRGAEHVILGENGDRMLGISEPVLNEDMAVFADGTEIILYHERTVSHEVIYTDEEAEFSDDVAYPHGKRYEPVCWKGSEIYLRKYDMDTEKTDWIIYDTKDGSLREMGTTAGKIVNYGLGDYLFVFDEKTESEIALTEEELFGTGANTETKGEAEADATPDTDPDSEHMVVWASMVSNGVSAETQEEINRILQEEGCSYQVEFQTVNYEKPDEDTDIGEYIRKLCPSADIMQVADSSDADTAGISMIRGRYFQSLQSYLDSDVGKNLWNAIPTEKWETVSVDGEIYTVPNTGLTDQGIYFVLNPKYVSQEMLEGFDGTMQGVEKLLASLEQQPGSPVLLSLTQTALADSAGGRYYGGLFWQENGSISAWYRAEPVRALYESLHRLYRQGAISQDASLSVNESSTYALAIEQAVQNRDFAVYIGSGNELLSDKGYDWSDCTVVYGTKFIASNVNCSTGISATSDNKEEAEDFLLRAYTDQRIANLMIYGEDLSESIHENGGVLYSQSRYESMLMHGLAYGNTMAASPMKQENTDSRAAAWSERMKKYGKKSIYLGLQPDLTSWEDAAETLVSLVNENENADVWKQEDFEQAYASLEKKSTSSQIEDYIQDMVRQQKERKK